METAPTVTSHPSGSGSSPASGGVGKLGKGKQFWGLEEGDGTEDEDGGWKFVGDYGDRLAPDPTVDLRLIGAKSKFWALTDNDDSDEEVVSQSPYTSDLVHHAAVMLKAPRISCMRRS